MGGGRRPSRERVTGREGRPSDPHTLPKSSRNSLHIQWSTSAYETSSPVECTKGIYIKSHHLSLNEKCYILNNFFHINYIDLHFPILLSHPYGHYHMHHVY